MEEFKPNSHRSKSNPSKKSVEKVIKGEAKQKKKNNLLRIADVFIPEDVESVKAYVIEDVIIPLIKRAIIDTVNTVLYGETGGKKTSIPHVSYRDRSVGSSKTTKRADRYTYDDVVFDTRSDADEVLDGLDELICMYGQVSVGDLFDLAGMDTDFPDYKYGWNDISSARIIYSRDGGYMIRLPKPIPLD